MPDLRNLRRARLVWLFRAAAFRRWARSSSAAVRSSSTFGGRRFHHHNRFNAANAVYTWHAVIPGFYPPELLPHPRQEQVAHATEDQVAFEPLVAPALVLVQADLGLLVLETALDAPSRERDEQHLPDRRLRGSVADEELQLAGVQHLAGDDQVQRLPRQAVRARGGEPQVLDLPDHRPLVPVLDPPLDPGLVAKPVPVEHRVDPPRRRTPAGQAGRLAAAAAAALVERPGDDPRRLDPAREVPRHLADELLASTRQLAQQLGLAAVPLVERQPVEAQAVGYGVVIKLQGDLPLGPVHHVVGDAGLAAPVAVVGPGLRQVEFAVEQAVESVPGVGQVDRDDAVLLLADGAAPLPLDAGGLVPLLDVAGLVEDPDGMRPGVVVADDPLEVVAQPVLVPVVLAEELLQGPRRHAGVDGDRLDALLGDVRELSGDVHRQVGAGVLAREAVVEP